MSTAVASTLSTPPADLQSSDVGERPVIVEQVFSPQSEMSPEDETIPTQGRDGTGPEPARRFVRVRRFLPKAKIAQESCVLLEKWEGVVIAADAETFTARLFRSGERATQQAVFSRNELSPEEQGQIEVGAPFVWTIGYRNIGTTRHRDSVIYFRRLAAWDAQELVNGIKRGVELEGLIGWK